ncbi:MAG: DUF2959 domain-containing protein [Desulfobulbaceae bacterium]|nr:DUF2959 domain-containing protein [Desulfobulbaceae bacterium]
MEKVGYHKRDILTDRIENARDSQEDAKEQFQSALERFSSVIQFEGGDLQEKYDTLNREFKRCEARSDEVSDRIRAVEDVSGALFEEWEDELGEYSSASLRRSSEQKLRKTRQEYNKLIIAMKRAEKKIGPVLSTFRDQVLFLKHNLNAKAISSLRNELSLVEADVSVLVREMESSIQAADTFIHSMAQE